MRKILFRAKRKDNNEWVQGLPIIVGMDNRFALEMIRFGSVHVDYERLIDKQFENTGIYSFFGYSLLCPDAAATMEISYV